LVASQTIAVPPLRDNTGSVPAATVAQMHDRARVVGSSLFVDPYLAQWVEQADTAIDASIGSSSGQGSLDDAGISSFTRWNIAINAGTATARVRTQQFIQWRSANAQPLNRIEGSVDHVVSLVLRDGRWLVAGDATQFAPGSEP
jgi:hypothetical protein